MNDEETPFEVWWVKAIDVGKAAWIVLEADPGGSIPGWSGIQVHVFDKGWKRLTKQAFPTGYRSFLKEVSLVKDNPLKQELLVAKVTSSGPFIKDGDKKRPAFEQGDFQRQYYALLNDKLVLVRLEDDNGQLAQAHYRFRMSSKGPAVPNRTRDDWVRSLNSANPVEKLATLVWLSGMHLSSSETRYENHSQESVEDSKLFEAVRDTVETKKALRELANSKNSWIQEYAKFALEAKGEE